MKKMTLILAVMAVAMAPALAQRGFDKPPPPGPAQPLQVPAFSEAKLPNGLTVVVAERHGLPLVTAMVVAEAGSLLDPPAKSGLASLTFTLMGKGAKRAAPWCPPPEAAAAPDEAASKPIRPLPPASSCEVDAATIAISAEALGGSLETDTGARSSRLSMTVATNRLADSLALMADVARAPTFPDDELERSRAQTLDAIKLGLSDPATLASLLAHRLYWGDTPNGIVTTPASLARIRREDLVAFHRQLLRPDRVTLVLAGDVDLPQAKALADRYFGKWKVPAKQPVPPTPLLAPKPMAASTLLLDLPGAGQSAVAVLAPYAAFSNAEDQRALLRAGAVANGVLGVGYSSRINEEVRIKRGLSYGANSTPESLVGGGMLMAFAQTKNASALEVAGLLRGEILKLAQEDVPAPELAAREAVLVGDFGRQLETTAGMAAIAAEQVLRQRDLAELQQRAVELLAVDAPRVRAFAAEYWKPEALRTVIVADFKTAGEEALRKQYPDAWVIRAGELDLGSQNLRRAGKK